MIAGAEVFVAMEFQFDPWRDTSDCPEEEIFAIILFNYELKITNYDSNILLQILLLNQLFFD